MQNFFDPETLTQGRMFVIIGFLLIPLIIGMLYIVLKPSEGEEDEPAEIDEDFWTFP